MGVEGTVAPVAGGPERTIRAPYLVGADGPRGPVRRELGPSYEGEGGAERDVMGGRMLAMHLRAPAFYAACPHPPSWTYWTFNNQRRALMAAVDGRGRVRVPHPAPSRRERRLPLRRRRARPLRAGDGRVTPVEIISRDAWLAGRALVANGFGRGRVILGGDAVHLFTPTGAWATTPRSRTRSTSAGSSPASSGGWHRALLDSYEAERRPVALRNTAFARRFAESIGQYRPTPAIEADGPAGEAARGGCRRGLVRAGHLRHLPHPGP